jgi:hypothetical protein
MEGSTVSGMEAALERRDGYLVCRGEFMSKCWSNVLAGATALILTAATQTGVAQEKTSDYVSRDAKGDLKIRDDAAGFGADGQLAISTDQAFSFSRTTQDDADTSTTITFLPGLDYFVIENLSVGGMVGLDYSRVGDSRQTTFLLGPRVGYNFEFSRMLSVWPRVGLLYSHTKNKVDLGDNVTRTVKQDGIALDLFLPVMVHPAPHFFAGLGPFLRTDLNGDNRATSWGVKLTVGGWI